MVPRTKNVGPKRPPFWTGYHFGRVPFLVGFLTKRNADKNGPYKALNLCKNPFFQYGEVMHRTPMIPGFLDGFEEDGYDPNLIQSPRVVSNKDLSVFRPQNFNEKAALNRGWLDSSRSDAALRIFLGKHKI